MRFYIFVVLVSLTFSCGNNPRPKTNFKPSESKYSSKETYPRFYDYEIVNSYKHDKNAFTQGLVFHREYLYEGTGGSKVNDDNFFSSLRKVDIKTGKILQKRNLADNFFGEGIAILKNKIYQLTWHSGIAFVYDLDSFKLLKEHRYNGEGWGLTTDGVNLLQSDGTHIIRVVNPDDFKTSRVIEVLDENQKPLMKLNELEYIKDEIWANVWETSKIARIDPKSGKLLGWIDFKTLVDDETARTEEANVLNGIAYDEASDRLFVTGKKWSRLFEVKVKTRK